MPCSAPRAAWVLWGPISLSSCLALQSLDLAEYDFLFALSFTTPTFDSEVAPSFGTLLATVNVALNMLGEVSWPLNPSLPSFPNCDLGHVYLASLPFIKLSVIEPTCKN